MARMASSLLQNNIVYLIRITVSIYDTYDGNLNFRLGNRDLSLAGIHDKHCLGRRFIPSRLKTLQLIMFLRNPKTSFWEELKGAVSSIFPAF